MQMQAEGPSTRETLRVGASIKELGASAEDEHACTGTFSRTTAERAGRQLRPPRCGEGRQLLGRSGCGKRPASEEPLGEPRPQVQEGK